MGTQYARFLLVHGDDPFLVDDRGGILTIGEIKASRFLCDLGESRRIQFGIHRSPVLIPDKIIPSFLRLDRDQRSRSRTESDREDPDTCGLRLLGRFDATLIQFLAIRHQYECTAHRLPLAEGCDCEPDRRGNIGTALRDRARIKIVDGGQDSTLV